MFHDMEDLSSNQANKCYQNLILPLIPLQYFHTKIGRTSSFKFSHFLMKYVEETSRTTGTGRGCQDIKTSLNTMLLRTGFVDSCQSFFFEFLDIIQLEQNKNFNNSKANLNRDFGSSTKPVWCSGWPLQAS